MSITGVVNELAQVGTSWGFPKQAQTELAQILTSPARVKLELARGDLGS